MDKAIERNYNLKLNLGDQVDLECEEHIYFPLYLRGYEDALRSIFFRVLRGKCEKIECEDKFGYALQKEASNIISFMGERGSGKTTAMKEFCNILDSLNDERKMQWWINRAIPATDQQLRDDIKKEKFFFKVLDPIDASTLGAKEDLFELLLASIYRAYEEKGDNWKKDHYTQIEIRDKFKNILEGYYAIKNARNEDFGDSYITRLKYISTSVDIKDQIEKLLDLLLKGWCGKTADSSFLVIAIDDLDLNIFGGYDMLEQLHKYFFSQRIIIAVAVDYEQMDFVCRSHYLEEFLKDKLPVDEVYKKRSKELSRDYITKIMPMDSRVFMPDVKTLKNIVVDYDENNMPVKQFLMHKVAERMGIFYDANGMNTHFCEQRNVRELVNYNNFLDSLDHMNYGKWEEENLSLTEKKAKMHFYDSNHERFKEDINKRLANRLLNEETKVIFEDINQKKIEQRAAYICQMWQEYLSEYYKENIDFNDYQERYVYGELLEVIYKLEREDDNKKALIKCLLASLTAEMVRENISSLKNLDTREKTLSKTRLKEFLGKSFGGDWTKELVPEIRDGARHFFFMNQGKYWGFSSNAQFRRISIDFSINRKDILLDISKISSTGNVEIKLKKFFAWLEKEKIIPTLEMILMLFTPKRKRQGTLRLNMEIGKVPTSTLDEEFLMITGIDEEVIQDILGFVEKTTDYVEKITDTQKMLADMLSEAVIQYGNKFGEKITCKKAEEIQNAVHMKVKELSIHSIIPWEAHCNCAFPYYDVDFSYNVMKRARAELRSSNPASISEKECYTYLKRAYEKIGELLEREQDAYGETNFFYAKDYLTCPFVEGILHYDNYLNPNFPEILQKSIANVARPVHLFEIDEPESLWD